MFFSVCLNMDDALSLSALSSSILVPSSSEMINGKRANIVIAGVDLNHHCRKSTDVTNCLRNRQSSTPSSLSAIALDSIVGEFSATGFQASHLGSAFKIVDEMLDWSLDDVPIPDDEDECFRDSVYRQSVRSKLWLSYTSNMVSSGCREYIRFLVQHNMVQVLVTTAGGIEEDFIKCLPNSNTYLGSFNEIKGPRLRQQGLNRIGNLICPNDNYCRFDDWITPIINTMHDEQDKNNSLIWSPSTIIKRLGMEINDERSIYYWAAKNNISVFCPALTDGSLGDMLYMHTYRRPGFIVDIVSDIRRINDEALRARKSGVIILGGGVNKHHTLNANLMRNGADWCVFINTGIEYDGSDAGASPDEAVSWGKLRPKARSAKVWCDASIAFPLLVARCFLPRIINNNCSWGLREKGKERIIFDKTMTEKEQEEERRNFYD
jgi:deoxyhypusine synthase